jgi:hypothetical protein
MKRFLILSVLATLLLGSDALAETSIEFSITSIEPVSVMRYTDPDTGDVKIGYTQSTELFHREITDKGKGNRKEDGLLYYSLKFKKIENGFRMDISYDFASLNGESSGILNSSIVSPTVLKNITSGKIKEKAAKHADALAPVIYNDHLKGKLPEETVETLRIFLKDILTDLLKSLPADGLMIMRRWDDLA